MDNTNWTSELGKMKGPGASNVGTGSGNIPYAKGIMSGDFGTPPALAREVAPPSPPPGQPSQPAPQQGSPQPAAGPPAGGAQGGFMDPNLYFQMVEQYVQALMKAAGQSGG